MELTDFCLADKSQLLSLYHNAAVSAANSFRDKWKKLFGEDLVPDKKVMAFRDLRPATLDEFVEKSGQEKKWDRFRYPFLSKEIPEELSTHPRSCDEIITEYVSLIARFCRGDVFMDDGIMHDVPKKEQVLFDKDVRARKKELVSTVKSAEKNYQELMSKYQEFFDWGMFWLFQEARENYQPKRKLSEKDKKYLETGKDNAEYRARYNELMQLLTPLKAHKNIVHRIKSNWLTTPNADTLEKTLKHSFSRQLKKVVTYFNGFFMNVELVAIKQKNGEYCCFLTSFPEYGTSFLAYTLTGKPSLLLEEKVSEYAEIDLGNELFHTVRFNDARERLREQLKKAEVSYEIDNVLCYHTSVGLYGDIVEKLNRDHMSILDFPNSVTAEQVKSLIRLMEKTGHLKVEYTGLETRPK